MSLLKQTARTYAQTAVFALAAMLLFLTLWSVAAHSVGSPVLPAPTAVLRRVAALWHPVLKPHATATVARVVVALGAAVLSAIPVGLALYAVPAVRALATPLLYALYPVPKIALLPLVLLLVGIGEGARIFLVWLVLFFQVLVALRDALDAVPREYLLSIRSLGGGRRHAVRYVLFPAVTPAVLSALRVGSGTALAVLFFAETFFTERGLGLFVVDSWMRAAYLDMYAGITTIGGLGFGLFVLLDLAQRTACAWQVRSHAEQIHA